MSKQSKKGTKESSIYDHIELIDEDENGNLNVNWDEINKNYSNQSAGEVNVSSHKHHHSHSSSGHSHHRSHHSSSRHGSSSHSSGSHSSSKKHSSSSGHRHHSHHKSHHSSSTKNKWSKKKKFLVGFLIFLAVLLLSIVTSFFILRYIGKRRLTNNGNININVPENIDYESNGKIIYYKGHKYQFRPEIASILFMGIDNHKLVNQAMAGQAGQADALYLFTYDTNNGKIKILSLNRDTITDIERYDANSKYYDTHKTQLCLAYAYGDGKKESADKQLIAVRRLLYNIPINTYYAIDLTAIKILNDDLGGIKVTPKYSFLNFQKGIPVVLRGDQAEKYVRYRNITLLDDNLRRIECQKDYINQFSASIVPAVKKDYSLPIKLYNDSSKYTVTNINVSDMTYLTSQLASTYSGFEMYSVPGKYKDVTKDASAQFYIDKTKLFETILKIFYKKID